MPIEIKELVIKASVSNGTNQQPVSTARPTDILKLKKEITRDVTERVLKILNLNNER
jgi:hypothetical protein